MLEYKFSTSQHSQNLFKNNIVPRLAYVQDINEYHQNLSIKHSHSQFLEIIHIITGCVIYEINQKHYRLTPGDTLVINPQQIHRISESSKTLSAIVLGINNLQIQGLAPNYLIPLTVSPIISINSPFKDLQPYFLLCRNLAMIHNKDYLINNPQTTLLTSLITIIHNLCKNANKSEKNENTVSERIKYYLDAHYLEDINLEIIAKNLHLNKFYLSHCFKNYMGISPMQYINKRRISEAQMLLISTKLTITEISFRCGFNNSNYFQTTFKKAIGITPGQYRKNW